MNKEEKYVAESKGGNLDTCQDDEISFYDLWIVLEKRKMIIIATFLIFILVAMIYCFTASPIYRLETSIKIYLPQGITTVEKNAFPTAKELLIRLSKIIKELKIINELNSAIFNNISGEITDVRFEEIKGAPGTTLTDRLNVTIEAKNRETLAVAPQQLIVYIENLNEYKVISSKIISELNEKIALVRKADKENDIQLREIEKRLNNAKVLPVGFDPFAIRQSTVNLKMEKYRIELEIMNYKMIQLLEEPIISKYPVKPQKANIIIIASILSLMFGIFMVFVVEYYENMKRKKQRQ